MNSKELFYSQVNQGLTIKSNNENGVCISGYASVYNIIDQQNDLIIKGAFASATTTNSKIKLLWQHDSLKPIGIIKSLVEDDYGLKIEAVINNKTSTGVEVIELIRQGAVDGLSIGFNIKIANYNNLNQRVITEAELIEVSIVTFPANNQAKIIQIQKHLTIRNNNMSQQLATKEDNTDINKLNSRINNLENFLARPNIETTQDREYKNAFSDYIRKGNQNGLIEKSLHGGNEEGGVLLVPALYNSIITAIRAKSPIRQLASTEVISSNALDIVIEDGKFSSGWVGDIEDRSETDTAKLRQKRIFVHELYAQPKASQTLIDDAAINVDNWLVESLRDSFIKAENDAFINGDGKKKPRGILSEEHMEIEKFTIADEITTEKLLDFINLLDEDYLSNASFLMNRVTLSAIQKLKDSTGRFIWQQSLADSLKQTIFGIPIICCSEISVLQKNNIIMALGDFKAGYKIVDRSNINIMRDPYTDKPFIKFYAVKRVGGDVVDQKAIKLAVFK